jgi:hypothetical protein
MLLYVLYEILFSYRLHIIIALRHPTAPAGVHVPPPAWRPGCSDDPKPRLLVSIKGSSFSVYFFLRNLNSVLSLFFCKANDDSPKC